MVKNLPAMQKTQVSSLDLEDSLQKSMATHSSILAWAITWTQEPGRLQSTGSQRVRCDWVTFTSSTLWNLKTVIEAGVMPTRIARQKGLHAQESHRALLSITRSGRSLEKEMATHSSILAWGNPMDRGAWYATVHGVAKSRTWPSDFTHSHKTRNHKTPRRKHRQNILWYKS